MAFDEHLLMRLQTFAHRLGPNVEKRMFGGVAFMYRDYMAFGPIKDELMVRVGPDAYEQALEHEWTREMDFTGKPMRGYVIVTADGLLDDEQLFYWMSQAVNFVLTLPEKAAKQPKTKNKKVKKGDN